jgi:hypothetical protein
MLQTQTRELFFRRCLWCGTPDYRRSCCRACVAPLGQGRPVVEPTHPEPPLKHRW